MSPSAPQPSRVSCRHCADGSALGFDFTMAFQPIVDVGRGEVFGYEALVRGLNGEGAGEILGRVNDDNRYLFDQQCRIKAISLAAKLGVDCVLSINFLPNAVYQPERCLRTTLETAREFNFPLRNIMFEFTEVERISDADHVKRIVDYYQDVGFFTAIDDFGSGYSGLGLLADFQTGIVKLDMELIRNIHIDRPRQTIVSHCVAMFRDLNIQPLAEGIECREEMEWLRQAGIELMQGYWFAKPQLEALPAVNFG